MFECPSHTEIGTSPDFDPHTCPHESYILGLNDPCNPVGNSTVNTDAPTADSQIRQDVSAEIFRRMCFICHWLPPLLRRKFAAAHEWHSQSRSLPAHPGAPNLMDSLHQAAASVRERCGRSHTRLWPS